MKQECARQPAPDCSGVFRLVLLAGLGLSFTSMALGLLLLVMEPATIVAGMSPHEVWLGLPRFDPGAFLNLGLLCLMATPMARVAVSLVVFALAREWLFLLLTAAVFLSLVISLCLGVG